MSYILDALRRAQNERENIPLAPQIGSDENGQPVIRLREPLPVWAIAAAAAVIALLVAGLLAWILWPDDATETEAATDETAVVTPAPAPASATPAQAAAPSSSINSLDDIAVSDGGVPAGENLFNEVPPLASDEEMHRPAVAAAAAASPEESVASEAPPAPPQQPAAPAAEPAPPPEPARSSTVHLLPPTQVTQPLAQMSEDYRAAFPKLKIEVHVYDDDPASRFVLIDGHRYKEGDALAQGAQLVRITSEGLVCSFRGSEVLVPATQ